MDDIPLTPWLEKLRTLASATKEKLDAEAVHDLRVAASRLRVWLALSGMRVLQDDLSWLRRSAEPLRDLDVVFERLGSRTWARELGVRRELLVDEFIATLSGSRVQGLLAALEVLPPLPAKSARKGTVDLKEDVERQGARAGRDEDDLEPIHRLRRRVRKLRYAVEWQGEECSRLEGLQEALGEVGDLATAHKHLTEIGTIDGAEGDRVEIESELAIQRNRAVTAWKRTRRDVECL
jgi:CHAD domain-containing protein